MTSTVTGQRVPDPGTVLKRVHTRIVRELGDDPLPAEMFADFVDAVQQQIVEPLLDAVGIDDMALIAELETLRGELDEARRRESERTGHLNDLRDKLAAAEAERVRLGGLVENAERKASESAAAAATWESEYERVRDEQLEELVEAKRALDERSSMDDQRHKHEYPAERPGEVPGDCECGHPYPRAHILDRSTELPAEEPDAWARFFAGLRNELADWQPGRTTR